MRVPREKNSRDCFPGLPTFSLTPPVVTKECQGNQRLYEKMPNIDFSVPFLLSRGGRRRRSHGVLQRTSSSSFLIIASSLNWSNRLQNCGVFFLVFTSTNATLSEGIRTGPRFFRGLFSCGRYRELTEVVFGKKGKKGRRAFDASLRNLSRARVKSL